MKISVTAKHISNGIPGDKHACPVALAMKEKKGVKGVSVGCRYITFFSRTNTLQAYDLTPEAEQFIFNFDQRNTVSPITFTPKKWKKYVSHKTVL